MKSELAAASLETSLLHLNSAIYDTTDEKLKSELRHAERIIAGAYRKQLALIQKQIKECDQC